MDKATLQVREVRAEEYEAVGRLVVESYDSIPGAQVDPEYNEELMDVAARASAAVVLVAADPAGTVVGTITYAPAGSRFAELAGPVDADIRAFAVAAGRRGMGIGRDLLAACLSRAAVEHRTYVWLTTSPWMGDARRLYERTGFVRVPHRDRVEMSGGVAFELLAYRLRVHGRSVSDDPAGAPLTDERLGALAERLSAVGGVIGVLLGGSRGRGEHSPESDFDLGLYYRSPLDINGLRALAREVSGPDATLTDPGQWGPWVDGGGWLTIDGQPVDWIYRDLNRVERAWEDAQAGLFYFHGQVGHPLGVPDFAYPGEVALGVVLADPTGRLSELQHETRNYPPKLADALVARLSEATFLIAGARKSTRRHDTAYVAGCLFRVVGVCVHALHGRAGRWLINEKGCVASAGRLAIAPDDFAERAHGLLAMLGRSEADLNARLDAAQQLVEDISSSCHKDREV